MSFTEKRIESGGNRIPVILAALTTGLAAILAIPTGLIGGTDAVVMMAVGAGLSLAVVVGGYWVARLALRGPDRFATKLVVGGFVIRLVLLFAALGAIVAATELDPSRFVLWLVSFYFVLIMVEAVLLARDGMARPNEGTAR
jgi:hypothetical protein